MPNRGKLSIFNENMFEKIIGYFLCKFAYFLSKNAKKFDNMLLKYLGPSGAKACRSYRSRQKLSNEYLLANIGFDTAENEPF